MRVRGKGLMEGWGRRGGGAARQGLAAQLNGVEESQLS